MQAARIEAIDVVRLEAPPDRAARARWFYTEVAGLEAVSEDDGRENDDPGDDGPQVPPHDAPDRNPREAVRELRFRSGRIDLVITLRPAPVIEDVAYRVVITVPSLSAARAVLVENNIPCATMRGLSWTDRRIGVQDPAGNRITLKQDWPLVTF